MKKLRLDEAVLKHGLASDLDSASRLIMAGRILVNDQRIDKAGTLISEAAPLRLAGETRRFASRSGEKIASIWPHLAIDIQGKIAMDVGISTGGFTDFLLQSGAEFVFGVDVAYGITAHKIRSDKRVYLLERCNARQLTPAQFQAETETHPEAKIHIGKIRLVTMDLSFISILKVLPTIAQLTNADADFVVLVKPQFEASPDLVGPGGVISDPNTNQLVLTQVVTQLKDFGFAILRTIPSAVTGTKGNQEVFVHVRKN